MNPKNKLAEMPVRPLLYTMAVPLMLSLLIQSLYNIVDSIFVARLSETALTAASLVYAIQFLMIAIGVGTAVGLNALLSRKLGQKKPEEACRAATTGLFLMLGTSLVFTLVGLLFSNRIAAALTNDPELQQLCREYLSVNLVQQGVPHRKCSVSLCWGYDEPVLPAVMRFFHRSTFLQTVPDLYDRILCVTVRLRKRLRCHRQCGQRSQSRPRRCRPDGLRRGRRQSLHRLQTGRGWRSR